MDGGGTARGKRVDSLALAAREFMETRKQGGAGAATGVKEPTADSARWRSPLQVRPEARWCRMVAARGQKVPLRPMVMPTPL
jgi:hypothetical protein